MSNFKHALAPPAPPHALHWYTVLKSDATSLTAHMTDYTGGIDHLHHAFAVDSMMVSGDIINVKEVA